MTEPSTGPMTRKRSLVPLMRPRSLAIVGVSPKARFGGHLLRNLKKIGFQGPIFPVNPNYAEFEGLPCYPSLAALPQVPDCMFLLVPAAGCLAVIEEGGKLGVGAAIIAGQGFSDLGTEEGHARQRRLKELADRYGMAGAGPNCLGVSSYAYSFANTYADSFPETPPGGISILSQSGGLMLAAGSYAADRGAGLNYLVSFGNQAVVDIADYIDYLADDPATTVIACIMEGIKNGRRFRAAIERASPKKPIVIFKLGRSVTGQQAALAHTGTLAGRDEAYVALFRQNGVALATSLDGLIESAILFTQAKPPAGDGCAMFTISGGTTGMIADLGEAAGLRFPPFSKKTNAALCEALGVQRQFNNPMDTTGWPPLNKEGALDKVLDALIADDKIDLIGMGFRLQPAPNQLRLLPEMAAKAKTTTKPLIFISSASYTVQPFHKAMPEMIGFPLLEDMELGQRAVSHLVDYGKFLRRAGKNRKRVPARPLALDLPKRRTSLTEYESKKILADFGLPVTREALASSASEAAKMAGRIGFPVALKIQSPDVMHKSDAGGVVLGVASAKEARAAYDRILKNVRKAHPKAAVDGVLVQQMVSGGTELILGMNNDEQLGPVILLGLGGVFVEVMKDVALRLPPLKAGDVRDMLADLKGTRLLKGYRGAPAGDIEALVKAVVAFSDFVDRTDGRFEAIDINPLIVRPKGKGVVIADALMIPSR